MSEFRFDIITGEYIIMASERAHRPCDFKGNNAVNEKQNCPFCIGNEALTPETIICVKDKEGDESWSIKVIPNKYPIVSNIKNVYEKEDTFYENLEGLGIHEVVIDTPDHNGTMVRFSQNHMEKLFMTLQQRQINIQKEESIKYVQIFKNQGVNAGATKSHSHWQIVGVPTVLQKQKKLLYENKKYKHNKGGCACCDIIEYELKNDKRVIATNERFVAITPYASKYPYEIWLLPKEHLGSFSLLDSLHIKDLALLFSRVINSLDGLFPNIDFNICFEDAPNNPEDRALHHWYMQIIPRKGSWAGFELGTECYINTSLPEQAAIELKKKYNGGIKRD